jgi:hypothetical protein
MAHVSPGYMDSNCGSQIIGLQRQRPHLFLRTVTYRVPFYLFFLLFLLFLFFFLFRCHPLPSSVTCLNLLDGMVFIF